MHNSHIIFICQRPFKVVQGYIRYCLFLPEYIKIFLYFYVEWKQNTKAWDINNEKRCLGPSHTLAILGLCWEVFQRNSNYPYTALFVVYHWNLLLKREQEVTFNAIYIITHLSNLLHVQTFCISRWSPAKYSSICLK